jgi:hypothetical protein
LYVESFAYLKNFRLIDFFLPQFWKSEDSFVVNLRFISSQISANAFLDYVIDGTALASRFRL